MKIFFRPLEKKEASRVVLLLARILKIVFLIIGFASAFVLVIGLTSELGAAGFIAGLIGGAISFFLVMLSSLLLEALLVGASIIFENHYNKLENKDESTTRELFKNAFEDDQDEFM